MTTTPAPTAPRTSTRTALTDRYPRPAAVSWATRLHIELRKLVDTRGARALLLATLALMVGSVGVTLAAGGVSGTSTVDVFRSALAPAIILVPILGILTVTAEWRLHTALTTYTLDPHRHCVLAAKLIAVLIAVALSSAVAMVMAAACTLVFGLDMPTDTTVADVVLPALAEFTLTTLVAAGLGAALLFTPLAIVLYLLAPQVVPQLLAPFPSMTGVVGYLDVHGANAAMAAGTWPQASHVATVIGLWVLLPLAIGFWRNARLEP